MKMEKLSSQSNSDEPNDANNSTTNPTDVVVEIPKNNTDIVKIINSDDTKGDQYSGSKKLKDIDPVDIDDIKNMIFDFDNDLEDRIEAFMVWHALPNDMIFELTNKLTTMYLFSGSSMIKEFLTALIKTDGILDIIKIEFANSIN